jgi:high affinity Mn2+ porin
MAARRRSIANVDPRTGASPTVILPLFAFAMCATIDRPRPALPARPAIATGLGMFVRAGLAHGSVEEVDFTDIDQSISAGISLAGSRWGWPDDTVGVAVAANQISHEAKEYFAAGGLGGIIGDGQLPQAGPEQIIETYYSLAVFSFAHVTADYQLINNPAYNRQRGPASVFGLRLHAEF